MARSRHPLEHAVDLLARGHLEEDDTAQRTHGTSPQTRIPLLREGHAVELQARCLFEVSQSCALQSRGARSPESTSRASGPTVGLVARSGT